MDENKKFIEIGLQSNNQDEKTVKQKISNPDLTDKSKAGKTDNNTEVENEPYKGDLFGDD